MSMLPFLKKKDAGGVSTQITVRKADHEDDEDGNEGLMACAQDLLQAIQANDPKGLAAAFKAAFEICELNPHEEADHDSQESNEENE